MDDRPEHIEVGSFIGLAAVTGGDLTIDGVAPNDIVSILTAFGRLGIAVELGDDCCACRRSRSS